MTQHPTQSTGTTPAQGSGQAPIRLVLRIDALFELALGLVLAASPVTGLHDALQLPNAVSAPVVIGFGLLLLPIAAMVWSAARAEAPSEGFLALLAALNVGGALLALVWVVLGRDSFGAAGIVAVLAVALALAVLGVVEAVYWRSGGRSYNLRMTERRIDLRG
jgi:hypothetical protein